MLDQMTNLGHIHSFIAYVYRNIDNGFVSVADMDHAFFFWNGEDSSDGYTFPLDVVDEPRDISTKITITELSPLPDDRIAVITVSAGGISQTDTIVNPDPVLGNALNIVPFTLLDVPGDATELTVNIYSPYVPYNSGDSFISGGVVVDVESETPPEDCAPCDGQMTSLTLEYLGSETNATIKVYKDKVQPNKLIETFTDVNMGDLLTFVGTGANNKLGAKIRLTVNDDNGNYTEIHTSCSQPIGVGMVYDNLYYLIAGTSLNGGPICEEGNPPPGGDCGPCDGQMTSLTLEYLGSEANATIKVYKDKVQPNKLIATFTNVNNGDSFSFDGTGPHGKLGAKVRLTINDGNYTEVHTSCSQPIEVGMVYDNLFLLLAGTSHNGGDLCEGGNPPPPGGDCGPCDGQMTSLTLEYLGSEANATIKVYKDKVQPNKLIATFTNVNNGDSFSFDGTGPHGKLGAKVRITINGNNCNYTEVHTSCSQPIEVGMLYDNLFLLLAGTSHNGGDLCDDGFKSGGLIFEEIKTNYSYINAYPNPLVSGSTIEFEVAEQGNTLVELINIQGQVVKQLYNGSTEPGSKYSLLLNAGDLNKGIYILRMVNGTEVMTKKVSISK